VWWNNKGLKRAAELRLITCCYLGTCGYVGIKGVEE